MQSSCDEIGSSYIEEMYKNYFFKKTCVQHKSPKECTDVGILRWKIWSKIKPAEKDKYLPKPINGVKVGTRELGCPCGSVELDHRNLPNYY